MERRRFPREVRSLAGIHQFVMAFLAQRGIAESWAFDVDLVIEELFTNMIKYNRDGRHDIEVGLAATGSTLTIELKDFDVDSFDLTTAAPVDTEKRLREGRRGGLGLHLVRRIADEVRYEYKDRSPTVTVMKRLEP
jgi:serine/threonine-protein kinase RsbW